MKQLILTTTVSPIPGNYCRVLFNPYAILTIKPSFYDGEIRGTSLTMLDSKDYWVKETIEEVVKQLETIDPPPANVVIHKHV